MYPILHQLYYGNIAPHRATRLPGGDPETQDEFLYYYNHLKQLLREQIPALEPQFNCLLSELSAVHAAEKEEMFYQGFTLAVKLLTGALAYEQ